MFFVSDNVLLTNVLCTGRGWEASQLKLKSFEDLHKLWYVLQMERNRLETIRRFCRTKHIEMPNRGRLDKVSIQARLSLRIVGKASKHV